MSRGGKMNDFDEELDGHLSWGDNYNPTPPKTDKSWNWLIYLFWIAFAIVFVMGSMKP